MQVFVESAVLGMSLMGSFAVAVIVQKTALRFLLSCMGCSTGRARNHSTSETVVAGR